VRDVRQQDGTTAYTAIEHLTVLGGYRPDRY